MATIKLSILRHKPSVDGTYKIRVALCHHGETKYIATRFSVDSVSQFRDCMVVKRPDASAVNQKLRTILSSYQDALDAAGDVSMYTCRQVRDILVSRNRVASAPTFQSVCQDYISELRNSGRDSYAKLLEANLKNFTRFTHGEFLISEITPEIIINYDRYLRQHTAMNDTSIGMAMSRTRTIINRAIKRMIVKYDTHPFINYSIKSAPVREVDLSLRSFNKIRLLSSKEKRINVARDLFMLSFYLGGMNLADIVSIDFKNRTHIEYQRKKSRNMTNTDNLISIPIIPEAREIISRWIGRNGRLDFGYKFTYENFSRYITRSLAAIRDELSIDEKLVFYSARKSFSQFAYDLGIPDGIIDYCLGHSDKSRGVIRHYTKVKQKQAEMCISRVADYVKDPKKYEAYIELRQDIMLFQR